MRIRCYFEGYFDKGIKRGGALVCFYFKPKFVNAGVGGPAFGNATIWVGATAGDLLPGIGRLAVENDLHIGDGVAAGNIKDMCRYPAHNNNFSSRIWVIFCCSPMATAISFSGVLFRRSCSSCSISVAVLPVAQTI